MDRSGWARRADLRLRADYPHLHTRIFEIAPDRFTIVFDESLQKAEGFNVDEIRPVTLPLTVSNKIPDTFLRELPPIPDADLVQHFDGFPFSSNDLFNLIGSKFAHLPITALREGKYPDVAFTIEVSNSLDLRTWELSCRSPLKWLSRIKHEVPHIHDISSIHLKFGPRACDRNYHLLCGRTRSFGCKILSFLRTASSTCFNFQEWSVTKADALSMRP
jgi:hypothetical protein